MAISEEKRKAAPWLAEQQQQRKQARAEEAGRGAIRAAHKRQQLRRLMVECGIDEGARAARSARESRRLLPASCWGGGEMTYSVAKKQRGTAGEWFTHRARRFAELDEAMQYAATFAAQQRDAGVSGTRIVVMRGGTLVCEHNVNRGDVPASRANKTTVWIGTCARCASTEERATLP